MKAKSFKKLARKPNQHSKNHFGPVSKTNPTDIINKIYSKSDTYRKLMAAPAQRNIDLTQLHRHYMLRNADRMEVIKQSIGIDCLATAKTCGTLLTKEKLDKSSASQLSSIRREAALTQQILAGNSPGTQTTQIINVQQILTEQPIETATERRNPDTIVDVNALKLQDELPKGIEE